MKQLEKVLAAPPPELLAPEQRAPETRTFCKKAAYWYNKAAEHGVPTARFLLGLLYDYGLGPTFTPPLTPATRSLNNLAFEGH